MEGNDGIFVSYRRAETIAYAGWLADILVEHFGEDHVFRDIGSIEPGMDFVEAIERALEACAVMLVVIGRNWATTLKEHQRTGQEDYMRLEVATALNRDVPVIPVLVGGASVPLASELPDDLGALARLQAVELRDPSWKRDVRYLVAVLEKVVGRGDEEARPRPGLVQSPGTDSEHGTIRVESINEPDEPDSTQRRIIVLFVDGEKAGLLTNGGTKDLEVEPGSHYIEVRGTSYAAAVLSDRLPGNLLVNSPVDKAPRDVRSVDIASGEVLGLKCGFSNPSIFDFRVFISQT